MPAQTNSRIAGGTINPFRFVQPNPGVLLGCLQASGPGVELIGIASVSTRAMMGQLQAPAQGYPAAQSGEALQIFGDGEETVLMVGSGFTLMPDMLLTSDASGNGIPITIGTGAAWIGARAIEGGVAGDVIRVTVTLQAPYNPA